MSRVVIVARTRMHGDKICVGGHDLDAGFRSMRLMDRKGNPWKTDAPFAVGQVWDLRYSRIVNAAPHVEDVRVWEHRLVRPVDDLKTLVLRHARPWAGDPARLFDGTVRATRSGSAYVPAGGPVPQCSTGYWQPSDDLERRTFESRTRFYLDGKWSIKSFPWVGVADPPERIVAGALIRISLTRRFGSETAPEGYYVQISGVL